MGAVLLPSSPIQASVVVADAARERIERNVEICFDGPLIDSMSPLPFQGGSSSWHHEPAHWVIPALANAHDHGRGLPTLAYGAGDDALELWIAALVAHPIIDPGLLAQLALAKLVRSGVSSVVHCHNPQNHERPVEEALAVCTAARRIGVRLAYVVPLADRNPIGYGPTDAILSHVNGPARAWLADIAERKPARPAEQVGLVERIAEAVEGDLITVQYGPVGPQWASNELLQAVADASQRTGRRVHMHLLETLRQRQWADAVYDGALLEFLDQIGLLSARLTVAHGVWLAESELELLAEREVIVSVNTSSNLRLRSGTAPVHAMRRAGTSFAFGMDGMSIDDDEDALRELRLTHLLHGGCDMVREMSASETLHRAVSVGHRAVDGSLNHGSLTAGSPGDLVVLDGVAMAGDLLLGLTPETEVIVARACSDHVRQVVINGKVVVDHGRVVGVDEAEVADEVFARHRAAAGETRRLQPLIRAHQEALCSFYRAGGHLHPLPEPVGSER